MSSANRDQTNNLPERAMHCSFPSDPWPIQVLCGPMLCRLQIWSDAAWDAIAEPDRPIRFVHVPGLGWIGAVPVLGLN